jgi:glycosyltransferase involved in cell wall biosynthesis
MLNQNLNLTQDRKIISPEFMDDKVKDPLVHFVFRKPASTSNSIEFLFRKIAVELQNYIQAKEVVLPFLSTGFRNRIRNAFYLRRFSEGIIHITGDTYYAILGVRKCKKMITIHDLSFLDRTKGFKKKLLKLFWVTLPVKYAHCITVVSEATKSAVLKETNADPHKIHVITNFVDDIYQPVKRNFNDVRPRILQVGTDFNKNIMNLADSLQGIPCTLVIIGKLNAAQKKKLEETGISYVNRHSLSLEELHKEYVQADLLSFISTVEGFGLPVVEAQSAGLPVITSNCSSLPEVAGKGALLVDPHDVKSMRRGFMELINNDALRQQIVKEGYENAKRFSVKKVAAAYLELYHGLCSLKE